MLKPWKCNWLRYFTFYCFCNREETKKTRGDSECIVFRWYDLRGTNARHDTHWAAQPADSTHSSTQGAENTLVPLSFQRNPEPSCSTIKPSWQIYSIGITDVFVNTDVTAYFIWTVESTPANEHFSACLTLSNATLHLGCVLIAHRSFCCCLIPTGKLSSFSPLKFYVSLRPRRKKKKKNTSKSYKLWTSCAYN